MQRMKDDPALADLPAPVQLTPDQLVTVAAGTAAALGTIGLLSRIIVAGGMPAGGPSTLPKTVM